MCFMASSRKPDALVVWVSGCVSLQHAFSEGDLADIENPSAPLQEVLADIRMAVINL